MLRRIGHMEFKFRGSKGQQACLSQTHSGGLLWTGSMARVVFQCLLLASMPSLALAQAPDANSIFNAPGLKSNGDYFSQLPFENINMATGGLTLTFADFVLPGNGGRDLKFVRSYNTKTGGWTFGLAGVPLAVNDLTWEPTGGTWTANPIFYTGDGGQYVASLAPNLRTGPGVSLDYTPNNLLASSSAGGQVVNFAYDADDWRIRKQVPNGPVSFYVRSVGGQLLTEWTNTGGSGAEVRDYIYAGSRLIAVQTSTTLPPK